MKFSTAALENIHETGTDPQEDVTALRTGQRTRESLLAYCLDGAGDDRVEGWYDYVETVCEEANRSPRIYARLGDAHGYEVERGVRIECGDGESFDGVAILGWDCPIEDARSFAARIGLDVDWRGHWESPLPSREGFVEAMILCDLEQASAVVDRVNAAEPAGMLTA